MKSKAEWDRDLAEAGMRPVISLREASLFIGLSTRTLRRWRDQARLEVMQTGTRSGRILLARSELARLLSDLGH